jgi:hypothetical protein
MVATLQNVSETAYGRITRSLCPHAAACVDDIGHIAFSIGRFRSYQRLVRACENPAGSALSSSTAPIEYRRTGPTPWVSSSQPSSSSIGDRNCRSARTPRETAASGWSGRRSKCKDRASRGDTDSRYPRQLGEAGRFVPRVEVQSCQHGHDAEHESIPVFPNGGEQKVIVFGAEAGR